MPAKSNEKKSVKKAASKKDEKPKASVSGAVKKGDRVKVEYEGSLDSGEIFDASKNHGMPLEFEAGAGQMIKGFDDAVMGMKLSEEKKIRLAPDQAYGQPNPQMVKKVPRNVLPQDQQPEVGMVLMIGLPNGMQLPAKIAAVAAEEVTLDLNHPLAGKALNFKIKVVGIN